MTSCTLQDIIFDSQHSVQMMSFVWFLLIMSTLTSAELKCVLMAHGGLFVISFGIIKMPVFYADNLDTQNMVSVDNEYSYK